MQDPDKVNFEKMIRATATMYPTTIKPEDINTMMLKLFFASLREYSFEQVSYGFEKHLSDPVDGKFFPKPANIIKHLKANEPSAEQKAELAWAQVMRVMRTDGSYGSLKLDDKQALAAVKGFTSWKDLCMMPEKDMTWAKKEFISMYTTYENTPLEMLPSSLPGREELEQHKLENKKSVKTLIDGINNYRAKLEDK